MLAANIHMLMHIQYMYIHTLRAEKHSIFNREKHYQFEYYYFFFL